MKAGVKYVSWMILTFTVGMTWPLALGKDSDTTGTAGTTNDSTDSTTSASVTYAVASGVTAVLLVILLKTF